MALSKKNNEQISFDELEFEAEYSEQTERKYLTISGKEQEYEPTWEKYTIRDLDVGETMEGRVEIVHYPNDDKKYDALRVRILDDGEILDLYVNIPKPNENGYIENIRKGFDFYRTCYDFIYSVLRHNGEEYVVDENGEEYNNFKKINIIQFAKYVDQHEHIGIRITDGNSDSEYNSFIIYKME